MIEFYKNKRVLVTGHSGFKGAWLSLVLNQLGSTVVGLSDMKIQSGIYNEMRENNVFDNEFSGDIADPDFIKHAYKVAIKEKYNFYSYGDAMLVI